MGTHSGMFGVLDGVHNVKQWTINETADPRTAVSSATKGGTARTKGNRSWTGSFQGYGYPAADQMPGLIIPFDGYVAPSDDTLGGTGLVYSGDVMIDSVAIAFNWGTNEIIAYTCNFSGDGALTQTTGSPEDAAIPTFLESQNGKITYGPSTPFPGVVSATLTFTRSNKGYNDSTTGLWTRRKMGNLDWTLALTVDDTARGGPAVGTDSIFRVYVNATDYYELAWGHVGDYTGLTVNEETADVISASQNIAMNGYLSGGAGRVVLPDDTLYWGTAAA